MNVYEKRKYIRELPEKIREYYRKYYRNVEKFSVEIGAVQEEKKFKILYHITQNKGSSLEEIVELFNDLDNRSRDGVMEEGKFPKQRYNKSMTEYFMAILREFKLVEKDPKNKKFNATAKGNDLVSAFMD